MNKQPVTNKGLLLGLVLLTLALLSVVLVFSLRQKAEEQTVESAEKTLP